VRSFEFETLLEVCESSKLFQDKIKEFKLPEGFEVVIEPWPYGSSDLEDGSDRLFQALIFARDMRSGNADSNFYAYPIPLIPIMNAHTKKIIRIEEPATGGKKDGLTGKTHLATVINHCKTSEYVPELLPNGIRKDLKPLHIVQPEGPSFSVSDGNLISWQKWQMRVTFNPREGCVLHDIRYDGRSILYRLSISEMVRIVNSYAQKLLD
jgi:primary-amine oxidase